MERLSASGPQYRTRLLTERQAHGFASALRANTRFDDVLVVASSRATIERNHYVTFRRSNPERVADMTQRQQDARAQRAASEGAH